MRRGFRFTPFALALAGILSVVLTQPAGAQVLASVEINEDPAAGDPHPTIYTWEGENRPIKDPVQYYTFYYTGEVAPDGTVPLGTTIDRVAVPNTEWEQNRKAIVTQLAAYYSAQQGIEVPDQPTVTLDENFEYVETGVAQDPNTAGLDPRAAAEWTFYIDQFVLWQFYCRRVLMNERDAERANSTEEELQRYLDRQALSALGPDINVDEVLEEAQRIREEEEEDPNAPPQEEIELLGAEFDPDAIYADPQTMGKYRDEFVRMAEAREKLATTIFSDMLAAIDARKDELDRYEDWLESKQRELLDFARAWAKVQSGERVSFEDTFYLITKEPLESVPRDSRNVVRREVLTPQDLISRDGQLKGPEFDDSLPAAPTPGTQP